MRINKKGGDMMSFQVKDVCKVSSQTSVISFVFGLSQHLCRAVVDSWGGQCEFHKISRTAKYVKKNLLVIKNKKTQFSLYFKF